MHPRHATQAVDAVAHADHGSEEARGGASVGNKELEGFVNSPSLGNLATAAVDDNDAGRLHVWVRLHLDLNPQPVHAVGHGLRILGPQRALESDDTIAERCEDDGAVGDAL